ncbi:MAG: type I-E CRISPR-associated endonuclease Cas1e [bacterium]
MKDFHTLPKIEDSISYVYLEHGRLEQDSLSVSFYDDKGGKIQIPVSSTCLIMLGPGSTITHSAIKTCAENGCLIGWCGEEVIRYYATGFGETRNNYYLSLQAKLFSNPKAHLQVVYKMYQKRFNTQLPENLTLKQIRGLEGVRVRDAYYNASKKTGIVWNKRKYNPKIWNDSDPVNMALSVANSCLYGVCHAAITSAGFSPGLGFIHKGTYLSFVYDIADLYKTEITIPLSFEVVKEGPIDLSRRVRLACRDYFYKTRLLSRIIPDIKDVLSIDKELEEEINRDDPEWMVCDLWDPDDEKVKGGQSW